MKLLKIVLGAAIAIVFAVFIGYSLYAIYEPPRIEENSKCYKEYNCDSYFDKCYVNETEALKLSRLESNCYRDVEASLEYQECRIKRENCEDAFKKTTDEYKHSRNSFFVLLIIGIAAIIGGMFKSKLEGISSGFIGGGVLVILWSLIYTSYYWLTWSKYAKIIALGLVLALLIYFGYKKIENAAKKK